MLNQEKADKDPGNWEFITTAEGIIVDIVSIQANLLIPNSFEGALQRA